MPCLNLARLQRVGLVRPLACNNAEWLLALLVHAGIENGICRIILLGTGNGSGRGGIDPEGLKVRGSEQQYFFCHHLILPILLIFSSNFLFLGRAPSTEFPLRSLPVRDASRRRRLPRRRGDGTKPGAIDGVSPPLAPSQGCEQETTSA